MTLTICKQEDIYVTTRSFRGQPGSRCRRDSPVGSKAKAFTLVAKDLSDVTLAQFAGKRKVLNIFPSIDTGVCAASVRNSTS